MSFKYQAPVNYKPKTIVISGQAHQVKNGVVESKDDIYHFLAPLGFTRAVVVEAKKEVAAKA